MAQYYTKNGSIPTTEKDDSEGWFAAPDKPTAPEGCEVVWWSPPGWVIRPIMPVKAGFKYSWSQSGLSWVEHEDPQAVITEVIIDATTQSEVVETTIDLVAPAVEAVAEVVAPAVEVPVEVPVAEVTIDVGTASATPTI